MVRYRPLTTPECPDPQTSFQSTTFDEMSSEEKPENSSKLSTVHVHPFVLEQD